MFKFKRACVKVHPLKQYECVSGTETSGLQYKDCVSTCEGAGCNNDNAVEEIFSKSEDGNLNHISCYYCNESDYCPVIPTAETPTMKCPPFAAHACYESFEVSEGVQNVFRGCSAFANAVGGNGNGNENGNANATDAVCSQHNSSSVNCKQTCNESLCNGPPTQVATTTTSTISTTAEMSSTNQAFSSSRFISLTSLSLCILFLIPVR